MLLHVCKQGARILLLVLVGGLVSATMVRLSPGFGSDEHDLSLALSERSREALRAERMADANIPRFYMHYLGGLAHGNFGFSRSLNRPVSELLQERLPETLSSVAYGMTGGIAVGLLFALLTVFWRTRAFDVVAGAWSGLFLS